MQNDNKKYGIFFNRNHSSVNYGETGFLFYGKFFPDSDDKGYEISEKDFYHNDMTYVDGLDSNSKTA